MISSDNQPRRVMVFTGPENSGQFEQIDRLAEGRNVFRLSLKGLRQPDAKRALKQLRLSAEVNLLVIEDALPRHIMAVLDEAINRLISRRPPDYLYVIVTTTTLLYLERLDTCSIRRIIPYLFPRRESSQPITFGWDDWPSQSEWDTKFPRRRVKSVADHRSSENLIIVDDAKQTISFDQMFDYAKSRRSELPIPDNQFP